MINNPFPSKYTATITSFLLTVLGSFLFLASINTVSANNAEKEPIAKARSAPNSMMAAACTDFALLVGRHGSQTVERFDGNTGTWQETLVSGTPTNTNFILQEPSPNGPLLMSSVTGDIYKYDAFTGAEVGPQPFISAGAPNNLAYTEQMRIGLDGYLYIVSEGSSNTVKRFNPTDGSFVDTFITATGAHGLVQDGSGNWYLSDNEITGTIKSYDSSGVLQSTLYTYTTGDIPRGLTVDSAGDLYVVVKTGGAGTDAGNGARIDKFDLPSGTRSVFATLDDNSAPFAGIAWGPDNNLYIADYREGEVHVYDTNGALVRTITENLTDRGPHGIGFSTCIPQTGAIGNYIWLDENNDGYQDAGESGLPNVIVNLTDSSGTVYTTTTDANGGYLFSELVADTYTVTIPASNSATGGALENLSQSIAYTNPSADFGNQNLNGGSGYVISLSEGEENLTADFGYNWTPNDATLGDRIWVDSDGDGVQDGHEIGVSGVELTIYYDSNNNGTYDTPYTVGGYTSTTTTDENGYYIFDDLPAGSYVVTVTDDSGASHDILNGTNYNQTGDPDHFGTAGGINDNTTTTPVVLAAGDVFVNADFGYQPTVSLGSIGNTVWFDADADGVGPTINAENQGAAGTPDGDEYGIAGVTVALIQDSNGNGVWDAGEPIIASDITDANGQYLFEDLPITDGAGSDDYLVWVNDSDSVLAGLSATYDADGLTTPGTGQVSGANISAVSDLTPAAVTNQDFGYAPISHNSDLGAIGDTIWLDTDNSGGSTQDAGEQGIEGVIVNLTDGSGTVITTTTDNNGNYYFGSLALSQTYTVTVDASNFITGVTGITGVLQGMSNSYDASGSNTSTGQAIMLTAASPINLDQDFSYGVTTPGSIGNLVWLDSNSDGDYDSASETPIGGVTIDLYRDLNNNGRIDPGEPIFGSTVTSNSISAGSYGTNGNYLFEGLPVGAYIVNVTDENGVLAGYSHSSGTANADNNSQVAPYAVTITAGGQNLTADFGYYPELAVPMSVNLATFSATCQSSQVRITWESVSELNNLGFNLYRSNTPDDPQSQVNLSFIPSQVPGSGGGAYYEWLDNDIEDNSTYYYWIEDLDTSGRTSRHQPVSTTCGTSERAMMQIYLPVIQR